LNWDQSDVNCTIEGSTYPEKNVAFLLQRNVFEKDEKNEENGAG